MNRQLLAVIIGAVLLFAGGIAGALALTKNDSNATPMHTMSDGSTMAGDGTSMQGTHTMPDGSHMSDMDMTP